MRGRQTSPEKETPADAERRPGSSDLLVKADGTYRFLRRAFLRVAFLPPAFFRRAFFFEAFLRAAILGFTPLVRLLDTHRLCVSLATRRPDLRRCRSDLTALVRLLSDRSTHHLKAICLRSVQKPQG